MEISARVLYYLRLYIYVYRRKAPATSDSDIISDQLAIVQTS